MLNKVDLQRIFQQLKQFGCNQTEASIYVECLELGATTVMEVSAKLNLNRITCHSAVKELLKKGLLFETLKGKRRLIAAEDPDILKRLLQTKYNELKLMESNLDYITKILNSVKNVGRSVPTVKFYEGVDGFKKMLEETLSAKNGVRVFTYVDIFSKLLEPAYLENYFARRGAKNIYTKLIFPPCEFATRVNKKAKEYKIEVRLLPAELKWTSGFFNWDDKVALMSYTESRMTCTIIQNPDIADFFRNIIFELSWKQAVPCA